jgi:hypothetical protein
MADYRAGRKTYTLDVLQSITDWGNAVSAEVQALVQYNTELANLERLTGTILETHGIRFAEERYCSLGPLGRWFAERPYPRDMRPGANADHYPAGADPTEKAFQREKPLRMPPSPIGPDAGRPAPPSPLPGGLGMPAPEPIPTPLPLPTP